MKYKLIVIAMELDGHAGANAMITNDPEAETTYRNSVILGDNGVPSAALAHQTEEEGCTVEYFSDFTGVGDFTIVTREADELEDLLDHCIGGRTG